MFHKIKKAALVLMALVVIALMAAPAAFAQTVTATSLDMTWISEAWQYAYGTFNMLTPALKIGVGFLFAGVILGAFIMVLNWGRRQLARG